MSINPRSCKNSDVWNSFGSSCWVVSRITRAPANPIIALGSATIMSPKEAKLAITPAIVGLVKTEMNGRPAAPNLARAPLVYDICIKLNIPSYILAPPEAEKIITGIFFSSPLSIVLVTFHIVTGKQIGRASCRERV